MTGIFKNFKDIQCGFLRSFFFVENLLDKGRDILRIFISRTACINDQTKEYFPKDF